MLNTYYAYVKKESDHKILRRRSGGPHVQDRNETSEAIVRHSTGWHDADWKITSKKNNCILKLPISFFEERTQAVENILPLFYKILK